MKISFLHLPENFPQQARNTFRVSVMMFVASALLDPFYFYLAYRSGAWQLYTLAFSVIVFAFMMLAGAFAARRKRSSLSAFMILGGLLMIVVLISGLITGLGLILAAGSVLITVILGAQILSPKSTGLAIVISAAAGLLALFIDLFDLIPARLNVPALEIFLPVVAIVFVAVFGVTIIRQFRDYSLRTKLLSGVTTLTVGSLVTMASINYYYNQRNLTDSAGAALKTVADSQAVAIGNTMFQEVHSLQSFSLSKIIQDASEKSNASYGPNQTENLKQIQVLDQQWRVADAEMNDDDPLVSAVLDNVVASELREYRDAFPENVEVFVTDKYGANIAATNRTSDYYQADEEWWQAAYNNGEGAVYIGQPEFDESSQTFGLIMAVPLFEHGTNTVSGVMRTTLNISTVINILNTEILGGTGETDLYLPGEWVLDPEYEQGLVRADPEALARLNSLLTNETYDSFPYEGRDGIVSAAEVKAADPIVQSAIQNLGWVIIVHQDKEANLAPIQQQIRSTILLALAILAIAAFASIYMSRALTGPILRLTEVAQQASAGNLGAMAEVESSDEIGVLASTFNRMSSQLQEILQGLEARVAARTRNLELAAQVGRTVSQVRSLDIMLKDACDLILKEFNLYYVQVYLTDATASTLRLEAGTGSVGSQLTGRGHSLPLDIGSINGRAATEKRSVVIPDTAQNIVFRPNALLPDTRSEMAVPLIVADKVVGVLDMQSSVPGVLTEEVLPAFEALAGQLAVAIQNATLLAEAELARARVESQARRLIRTGWNEHLDAIHKPEQFRFVFDHDKVTPLIETEDSRLPEPGKAVSAPISVTGEALGSLMVEIVDETRAEQTTELVNVVARQVAQQIENLRLLEAAERYRHEAEQAARLQTLEGWQKYAESRSAESLGYLYDTKEVRQQSGVPHADESMFATPLKARDERIGQLLVQGLSSQDQEAVELVDAVAGRLGAHLENLRLFEETRHGQVELDKRARQLAAVAEISTASSQQLDVAKMLDAVVHLTQRQFDLYHAHVFVLDDEAQELKIAACGWKEGDGNEGTHETVSIPVDKEQSLVALAARTRQAVIVNNVKSQPGWLPNPLLPDTASEMAVPLVVGGQVLGILDVQSDRISAFTDEDANIQTTLASQVATAMQNARSFNRAQKQAEREAMLNVINQKIQSATSVEAVLQIAARELGTALGAPMTVAQLSMKDRTS